MTWKHPSSPVTKKFKVQQSATKVMATVVWDSCGMILLDILPKAESVNADQYCETLDRLRHAVRCKRPGLLRSRAVLHLDNATPHTAKRTKEWLECYRWDIIPCLAHSPDLAPSDFHLFGPLKRHLGGKKFEDEDELIGEVRDWFSKLDANFFTQGMCASPTVAKMHSSTWGLHRKVANKFIFPMWLSKLENEPVHYSERVTDWGTLTLKMKSR
ncbi:histone-lysine N-methyltransferase SETMAR [Plakobranchus ocellatus]|uniref:Histone-lysine N-methyltransferase SETMAR n=1 Tax=Plakobranchus ocellatus TaxID=259542 RepID=A0AAV4AIE4_9GAST|nr:histone-lysine N-methyltransferase SETMAR [Plakobranchus ocellatus]